MNYYRPLYRPAHFSAMPKGVAWDYVEAPASDPMIAIRRKLPLSRHPYGIISTERALTREELEQYELAVVEVDVCITGNPALDGTCGEPDCVCAPPKVLEQVIALRDEIRRELVKADEHARSIAGPHGRSGLANQIARVTVELHAEFVKRLDEIIGAPDDAGRTAIGNTPTCEGCGQPQDHCTCGDEEASC